MSASHSRVFICGVLLISVDNIPYKIMWKEVSIFSLKIQSSLCFVELAGFSGISHASHYLRMSQY